MIQAKKPATKCANYWEEDNSGPGGTFASSHSLLYFTKGRFGRKIS